MARGVILRVVRFWRIDVVASNQCYGRFPGAATIASMTEKRAQSSRILQQRTDVRLRPKAASGSVCYLIPFSMALHHP
ncbi:hypothetical protein GFL78_13685 [Rhizobium leguminosarum bv. viciae]|uniref:Secreted protein n=1 Tax=Rhizobium ruizarguesonis TaxID=2081791 RepID=A0AB38IBC1_9HYPH|nr:hypothetical protein [Rhizobium leguminosarum bv. viciae]TAU33476.1 hypothetical protein ELI47_21480 [Rhizobium ruizarguesonis]NKL28064.1 hypothetical protein [Rhizobium leguminosarum bv. viciae]TAW23660.1 hypothetical protein ELI20_21795 [Rhizobium ruizarguesonis]TAZ80452.1 hypothetical protein ELH68_22880 [Rhizobium ruizarguesonis]